MNKKTFVIGGLIVLLAASASVIVWMRMSLQQAQRDAAQATQALEAQKQADIAAKQAEAAQKEKDLENQLQIVWPVRGSQLCLEQPYSVSWQAPVDMDAVTVVLYTPTSSTRIGDYPAVSWTSRDLGSGSFLWDLTNAAGFVVQPSQVYKLTISGMYHGHEISTSTDGVFSIGDCK